MIACVQELLDKVAKNEPYILSYFALKAITEGQLEIIFYER